MAQSDTPAPVLMPIVELIVPLDGYAVYVDIFCKLVVVGLSAFHIRPARPITDFNLVGRVDLDIYIL